MTRRYGPRKAAVRKPAKPASAMTPKQIEKEMNKGIDERKHVQTPSVRLGRMRGWTVLEFGKYALHRRDADGKNLSNPIMNTKGAPDTYWVKNGIHFWVEYKKPGGKLSADQVALIAELRQQGETVYVFDSVGQMNDLLAGIDPPKHTQITGFKQTLI